MNKAEDAGRAQEAARDGGARGGEIVTRACTCPHWWFPARPHQDALRSLPHGYSGALAHHRDCAKWTADESEAHQADPERTEEEALGSARDDGALQNSQEK